MLTWLAAWGRGVMTDRTQGRGGGSVTVVTNPPRSRRDWGGWSESVVGGRLPRSGDGRGGSEASAALVMGRGDGGQGEVGCREEGARRLGAGRGWL